MFPWKIGMLSCFFPWPTLGLDWVTVAGHFKWLVTNKNVAKIAPAVEGNAGAQFMAKDREHGFGVIQKTLDMLYTLW